MNGNTRRLICRTVAGGTKQTEPKYRKVLRPRVLATTVRPWKDKWRTFHVSTRVVRLPNKGPQSWVPAGWIWQPNTRTKYPQRQPAQYASHSFVCSAHFTPDCFDPARELCGRKNPRTLTSSAVPTLFVFAKKESAARSKHSIHKIIIFNIIKLYNFRSTKNLNNKVRYNWRFNNWLQQ